ncbi:MAG: hypothetical protein E7311_03670 [Clostridiales bacterium]|nr:hypothetical protein [Clostridiales bacterium]
MKIKKKKINYKRGSEVVQVLMISAIFLVLIATVFYQNIGELLNGMFDDIQTWFDNNSSTIFADVQAVE